MSNELTTNDRHNYVCRLYGILKLLKFVGHLQLVVLEDAMYQFLVDPVECNDKEPKSMI